MIYRMIASGIATVALLAACSSGPPSSTPVPATPAPSATATPAAVVTLAPQPTVAVSAQPVATSGGVVGGDLAAKFPTQVDGQPVTDLIIRPLVDYLALGGPELIPAWTSALATIGIDVQTAVIGSATATVDGALVGINAFRVPGHDAATLIPLRELFSSVNEGDVVAEETVGGKSVMVVRSEGGYASHWMYANGDTLWVLSTSDADEAEAVFTALS